MTKIGGTGVIDTVAKIGETLHDKMGGTGFIETVAKMGKTLHDKNGLNSLWQKWVELVL